MDRHFTSTNKRYDFINPYNDSYREASSFIFDEQEKIFIWIITMTLVLVTAYLLFDSLKNVKLPNINTIISFFIVISIVVIYRFTSTVIATLAVLGHQRFINRVESKCLDFFNRNNLKDADLSAIKERAEKNNTIIPIIVIFPTLLLTIIITIVPFEIIASNKLVGYIIAGVVSILIIFCLGYIRQAVINLALINTIIEQQRRTKRQSLR